MAKLKHGSSVAPGLIGAMLAVPPATLALEWIDKGIFARLVSPHLHRLELVQWIPKLGRDLDAIAYRHFHYPPDPYLYWYAVTLVLCTLIGLGLGLRHLRFSTRDGGRYFRDNMAKRVSGRFGRLFVIAGLAMFLLWPWFGTTMLDEYGRVNVPGVFHDLIMVMLFWCYGTGLVAGPALIKYYVFRKYSRPPA